MVPQTALEELDPATDADRRELPARLALLHLRVTAACSRMTVSSCMLEGTRTMRLSSGLPRASHARKVATLDADAAANLTEVLLPLGLDARLGGRRRACLDGWGWSLGSWALAWARRPTARRRPRARMRMPVPARACATSCLRLPASVCPSSGVRTARTPRAGIEHSPHGREGRALARLTLPTPADARGATVLRLHGLEDGSIYTGITTDVARRMAEHLGRTGRGARYTHAPRDGELVGALVLSGAARPQACLRRAYTACRERGRTLFSPGRPLPRTSRGMDTLPFRRGSGSVCGGMPSSG